MTDNIPDTARTRRRIRAVALLGGGLAAGVIGAGAIAANAATTTSGSGSTATTASTSTTATVATPSRTGRPGNGETVVTGAKATALKAAALKEVPGSTVDGITTDTDSTGSAYEVHLTKADGTRATLLFDANLTYLRTDTNAGPRGHGGGGNGETAVTGTKAGTLKAAALAKVPGATVDEVSTDSGDAAYEVHLTKSDGTHVTVKFDKNLNYVAVEDGHGK